ncbi:MAG: exostosin family protein [Verrucomicrobiota bacterium]
MEITYQKDKKVYLLSAYEINHKNMGPQWLLSHSDRLDRFEIIDEPEQADFILFVENHHGVDPYFRQVFGHPVYQKYAAKCVLYHDKDRSITPMRTISPSIETWQYRPESKAPLHYLARVTENELLNKAHDLERARKYLYSFVGSTRTNSMRLLLMALEPSRALLLDSKDEKAWELSADEKIGYEKRYLNSILDSYFVLCPAGAGPASYRLFETMQLGRPPVIIADKIQLADGLDWEQFSITVKEKDVASIPLILEDRVSDAIAMGKRARAAWENQFAPGVSLQRLCEAADKLMTHSYDFNDKIYDLLQFRGPYHLRSLMRYVVKNRKESHRRRKQAYLPYA